MLVCWIQISQHLAAAMAHCCVQIHKLKQSPDLTFQICAHQAFACRNRHHRRASRPPVRKTQKSGHPKPCNAPPRASVISEKSPTRRLRFLTSRSCSWYTRRHDGLLVHRSTKPRHPTSNGSRTRHHARTMAPGTLTRVVKRS